MYRSICFVTCLLLLMLAVEAFAVPITFMHQGFASGSLGSQSFTDAAFVITAYGDTDNRQSSPYYIDHNSASIDINGIGVYSLSAPTRTYSNYSYIGFSRAGSGGYDLFNQNTGFPSGNWDMLTSFGPYSGTGYLTGWAHPSSTGSQYSDIETSGGILYLFNGTDNSATFEAKVGASATVPEPSTILLLGSGLLGLGWYGRKREKA